MALTILKDSDVPSGAQVEFNYQWNKWIKNLNVQDEAEQQSRTVLRTSEGTSNHSAALKANATEKSITLDIILKSNQYGITLINAYEKNKVMNDNLRKLLVESVLQYCIEFKHDLTVKDCSLLAAQIVQVFPGEEMVRIL